MADLSVWMRAVWFWSRLYARGGERASVAAGAIFSGALPPLAFQAIHPQDICKQMKGARMRDLVAFEGTWAMEREITDHSGGPDGRLTGRCVFSPEAGGLRLTETGVLEMAELAPMPAERRYFWRAQGAEITVEFDDGRFFHAFDPRGERAEAGHDCAPDRYDVTYDFSRWPAWTATWRVRGPRKDYTSVTRYTPA